MMDGDFLVRNRRGLRPGAEQLMPLRGREQRKIREPAPGIGDDGFQQVSEPVRHAIDRRRLEQIRAVLERDAEPVAVLGGHHRQVEERGLFIECDRLRSEPMQAQPRAGNAQRKRGQTLVVETLGFLMGEHHLENGGRLGSGFP